MKKIAFVTPWYGENIPGGAEMLVRGLVHHLYESNIEVEVLTTCIEKFGSDWNFNFHPSGVDSSAGFTVRRFWADARDTASFDKINAKLMEGKKIAKDEETIFMNEMVNSDDLYDYIRTHRNEYSLFVFAPYMFGTTYFGSWAAGQQAILIPCFHEEPYIHLDIYKKAFSQVGGIVYNAYPEMVLANEVFDLSSVQQEVIGVGVDTDLTCDGKRFRNKYNLFSPYILYAGRKDVGKNIYTLINYFKAYKDLHSDDLKLVLIGGGEVSIPAEIQNDVIDLGFVDIQDKYDAYAAALTLCQPSVHESFSLVVMESWLCKRPVLVHEQCDVTKHFVQTAKGGLYFSNYAEFEGCIDYLRANMDVADQMGLNGRQFVLDNFSYDVIVGKYMEFFEKVAGNIS